MQRRDTTRNLTSALGGLALLTTSTLSTAFFITDTGGVSGGNPGGQPLYEVSALEQGDVFFLGWEYFLPGASDPALKALAQITVQTLTSTNAVLAVLLENLSPEISNGDPRITAFGLDVLNISGSPLNSTNTGGTYLTTADDSNFPGFSSIKVCATSGNNCAGGGNGGIDAGLQDSFSLDLAGSFGLTPSLTLSDFGLKFQGGPNGDSFELSGVPGPDPNIPTDVPVPPALALLGLGLVALRMTRGVQPRG